MTALAPIGQSTDTLMKPHRELRSFLLSAFSLEELVFFLKSLPEGARILQGLPSYTGVSAITYTDLVVEKLTREGRSDEAFFIALLQERPGRADEVLQIARTAQIDLRLDATDVTHQNKQTFALARWILAQIRHRRRMASLFGLNAACLIIWLCERTLGPLSALDAALLISLLVLVGYKFPAANHELRALSQLESVCVTLVTLEAAHQTLPVDALEACMLQLIRQVGTFRGEASPLVHNQQFSSKRARESARHIETTRASKLRN